MARTIALLLPEAAHFPSSNFPQLLLSNRRPALGFDASTAETAYWTLPAVQGLTTPLTAVVTYAMASATSGGVAFDAAIEAISDGDALDTDASTSFDSVNTGTVASVPGTAGYIDQMSITLTNNDSIAAGDLCRLSLARAVSNASDTATGDCHILSVEIRDAA